jgi:hypothetical protein
LATALLAALLTTLAGPVLAALLLAGFILATLLLAGLVLSALLRVALAVLRILLLVRHWDALRVFEWVNQTENPAQLGQPSKPAWVPRSCCRKYEQQTEITEEN